MLTESNFKFVIIGHVDHGKSTLIGRLLYDTESLPPDKIEEIKKTSHGLGKDTEFAYLLDHLEEERRQGITIDTTQVFFKTAKKEYVIIDAPGHVTFVKNMISGASQAEAGILIVDVKEGIKEQTKRHAYILSLLGLTQVVVALNKMDLVDYKEKEFEMIKEATGKFLRSIDINPKHYIPISAIKGDNIVKKSERINWYKGVTVLESLDSFKSSISDLNKPLIFPVQDIYKIDTKRIILGRIEAGVIEENQKIKVLPGGEITVVKTIEKFLENPKEGYAGESIGITTEAPVFLDRGDIICELSKEPSLVDRFKASIFWMGKEDFHKDERVILKCATQEVSCKVENIEKRINSSTFEVIEEDAGVLKNLEVGEVIISTKKPIVVKEFKELQGLGRFVLVRNADTCAGGIVRNIS